MLHCSPESLIPLRLNAFASLLHVVSSASHNMAKAGLRLLDGDTKWNISGMLWPLSSILRHFPTCACSLRIHENNLKLSAKHFHFSLMSQGSLMDHLKIQCREMTPQRGRQRQCRKKLKTLPNCSVKSHQK